MQARGNFLLSKKNRIIKLSLLKNYVSSKLIYFISFEKLTFPAQQPISDMTDDLEIMKW